MGDLARVDTGDDEKRDEGYASVEIEEEVEESTSYRNDFKPSKPISDGVVAPTFTRSFEDVDSVFDENDADMMNDELLSEQNDDLDDEIIADMIIQDEIDTGLTFQEQLDAADEISFTFEKKDKEFKNFTLESKASSNDKTKRQRQHKKKRKKGLGSSMIPKGFKHFLKMRKAMPNMSRREIIFLNSLKATEEREVIPTPINDLREEGIVVLEDSMSNDDDERELMPPPPPRPIIPDSASKLAQQHQHSKQH